MEQYVAVIRHDDKSMEEEWMKQLCTVQTIDNLACASGIREDSHAMTGVRCDKHHLSVLNMVPLGHEYLSFLSYSSAGSFPRWNVCAHDVFCS